ncbi:MAG: ComEC/Rec2 family competence protein [Hyphomicrobiales bacterium]
MALSTTKNYYISQNTAVLRESSDAGSEPLNHLLFGDWLRWLGESDGDWHKVRCRGDEGWLHDDQFGEDRALEVNFVDIGQGDGAHLVTPDDQVILIDAGKTDNMARFLNWRYNLRRRKVAGVDDVAAGDSGVRPPFNIEMAVISHPDNDHYYGFRHIFSNPKLSFGHVYHNGIVERPISKAEKDAVKDIKELSYKYDLGLGVKAENKKWYLLDLVRTNTDMRSLVASHPTTQKQYISTIRGLIENPANAGTKFKALSARDAHLPGFDGSGDVTIELLGPVTEEIAHDGANRHLLRIIGNEGVTKNGHSLVFKLKIGRLSILLGGDLNTESEDYLLRHYCGTDKDASDLESDVWHLNQKGDTLNQDEKTELTAAEAALTSIVTEARKVWQVDVAKACHHGSHHFSETFLRGLNAIAYVVSSGDAEAYAHPRPDALGAFGKYGRGHRPLIFSTEIARSTREFTPLFKYFDKLKKYEAEIEAAASQSEKNKITKKMQAAKDRNVAVYGMITLRTDGERTIIAQKIEEPSGDDQKWDVHVLKFNEERGEFVYQDKTKSH